MGIIKRVDSAIHRFVHMSRWSRALGNRHIAKLFIENSGPLSLVQPGGKTVKFGDSEVAITSENAPLLASAGRVMYELAKRHGVRWSNDGPHDLHAEVQGITLRISTHEEAAIIYEVFAERAYALTGGGPVHVVDIGANIGITSLSFAMQSWVSHVTGFEPLKPTYEKAQMHLETNPVIGRKVTLHDFGLAGSDREMAVEYSPTWKGSVGIRKLHPGVENASDRRTEHIQLRKASTVLRELGVGQLDTRFIVKMDCEGAEYEITEDLATSGLIQSISALMIEWHDRGAESIVQRLIENGFIVLQGREAEDNSIGLIYAIRAGSPLSVPHTAVTQPVENEKTNQ